jgi:hypothetical protein
MNERRIIAGRPLTALAAVGVLIGHWIAYWLAVPNPTLRESILVATGHSYWMTALKIGVVLGVTAFVMIGLRTISTGGGYQGRTKDAFVWAGLRLAAIQMVAFVGLEVAERAVIGDPVAQIFANHLLVVGLATQVIVAALVALVSVCLARIVRRLYRMVHRAPQSRSSVTGLRPSKIHVPLRPGALSRYGIRGPPAPASVTI